MDGFNLLNCASFLLNHPDLHLDYNPRQPRDRTGRWSSGGGGSSKATSDSKVNNSLPDETKVSNAQITNLGLKSKNGANIGTIEIDGKKYFVKGGMKASEFRAEEKAYKIGEAMGLGDNVVPIKQYKINGETYAVSPYLGKEVSREQKERKLFYDKETAEKALLYDYVIDQSDRHMGNTFVTQSGQVKLIDNELSFGNRYFTTGQKSSDPLKYNPVNTFYIALGDPKKIKDRQRKNNFLRRNDDLDIGFHIDDMLFARKETKERIISEKPVKNMLDNKDKIIEASGNDPIVRRRLNHIEKTYVPGKTTYGELFRL